MHQSPNSLNQFWTAPLLFSAIYSTVYVANVVIAKQQKQCQKEEN